MITGYVPGHFILSHGDETTGGSQNNTNSHVRQGLCSGQFYFLCWVELVPQSPNGVGPGGGGRAVSLSQCQFRPNTVPRDAQEEHISLQTTPTARRPDAIDSDELPAPSGRAR